METITFCSTRSLAWYAFTYLFPTFVILAHSSGCYYIKQTCDINHYRKKQKVYATNPTDHLLRLLACQKIQPDTFTRDVKVTYQSTRSQFQFHLEVLMRFPNPKGLYPITPFRAALPNHSPPPHLHCLALWCSKAFVFAQICIVFLFIFIP